MKIDISGEEKRENIPLALFPFLSRCCSSHVAEQSYGTAFVARAMKHVGRDSCLTSSSMSCFHRGIIDDSREWHTWLYRYSTGEGS